VTPKPEQPSQEWLDAQNEPGHPLYGKTWAEAVTTLADAQREIKRLREALCKLLDGIWDDNLGTREIDGEREAQRLVQWTQPEAKP
jgi:hypothetical protein